MKHTVKLLVALTALAALIFGTAAFAAVYDQDFTLGTAKQFTSKV